MQTIQKTRSADALMMVLVSINHSSVSEDVDLFSERTGSGRDCSLVEIALGSTLDGRVICKPYS